MVPENIIHLASVFVSYKPEPKYLNRIILYNLSPHFKPKIIFTIYNALNDTVKY